MRVCENKTMPTQSQLGTAVERIKRIFQPLWRDGLQRVGKPAPVWMLFLIAVLGAFPLWRMSGNSDQAPRRWKSVNQEASSKLYNSLINPVACDPASPSCNADGPLQARHHDWNKPHAAVYSVAATPHPLPTLRDALSAKRTAGPGETDPFRFDLVLVTTVAKGASWDPGDRMMWTRVFVRPINFSFAGYAVAATDNQAVKVTSVEAINSRKLSAEVGLTVPGLEGPKAKSTPAMSTSSRRHRIFRHNTRNSASIS
jgi:hypothetical protein